CNRFMAADEGRVHALAGSAVNFTYKPCDRGRSAGALTLSTFRPKEETMSSRHSVLITSAPSRIGAVDADCFARGAADAGPVGRGRRRTKAAFQRGIRPTDQRQRRLEDDIRLEERRRERARIVQELHDTLLQGFLGASMVLDQAVEQTPADSPSKPALSRA